MKLSKTSEYALRILTYMARDPEQTYTAKSLVGTLKISDKYLRRLMTDLTKAGFIYSIQGRDGGYAFARPISSIHLSDIVDAVESMEKYTGCILGFDQCCHENPCVMHSFWAGTREEFIRTFTTRTLDQLDFKEIFKF
jgi:Rrf2 family protein